MVASAALASTGLVANVQRCSIHDGPGIRTTVFLKGCPLRCSWCHNPESLSPRVELGLAPERCLGCGECARVCPGRDGDTSGCRWPPPPDCCLCAACAEACPSGARQVIGRPVRADELVDLAARDDVFFASSKGGITFSGGEPLAQADFLLECLRLARERGLHTAIDTCGHAPWETVQAAAERAHLVLFDVKLMDPVAHRRHTGVDNRVILSNLEALSRAGAELWIRLPLVPGVTDDHANLEATAALLASLPRKHPVFLLPFHAMAEAKQRRLAASGERPVFHAPHPATVEDAALRLAARGLEVHIGGAP